MAYPLWLTKLLIRSGVARWLPSVDRMTDGGGGFLHYYSDRVLASPAVELGQAAAVLEAIAPDCIDLSLGAPRFELGPSATTRLPAERRGWPPLAGLPELRDAVVEWLLIEKRLAVNAAEEILITHGAVGAIGTICDTFLNPGDRVVLFDPCSPLYPLCLRQRRACVQWLPTWMEEGKTRFRLDQLVKALRRAKMVILNAPANPTGGVLCPEDLEQIAWWADKYDVLIVSDEVFDNYQYEGETSSIGTLPKAFKRTLTVGSVSKGYGLASARVGWLAGYRHLVRPCLLTSALQSPFVSTVCQQLAAAAIQNKEARATVRESFASRRRYAFDRLRAMEFNIAWPAGAFFLWAPVWQLEMDGQQFAGALMESTKVAVTPGEWFGPSGKGFVRISYATDDGRLREGLSRIAEFVGGGCNDEEGPPLKRAA